MDYWGIGMLAVGIGALQIVLDKGQQEDWFSSTFITSLAILSAVTLIALVAHDGEPIGAVDLDPPVTFLLGAERAGLPAGLVTDSDKAMIPLPGAAESLNVAAAGAIAVAGSA